MPWVTFTADHDHVWPSGAMSAFRTGDTVCVKREVAERAAGKFVAHTKKPGVLSPDL